MISIPATDLQRMFQQVTPHMSDDEYIPVIHTVRLEARDGWLYVIATDRYTFAAGRRPVVGEYNSTGHIPGRLVPAVAAWLDGVSESGDTVSLSLPAKDALIFTAPGRGKLIIECDADDYEKFPDWRKMLHEALTAAPRLVPVTGFTTRFLTRWQHAAEKLAAWQEAPGKPLVLLDSDGYFAGMQMPVRFAIPREDLATGWIAATVRTATVDGLTYDLDKTWEDVHGDPWAYSGKDCPDGMPLMVLDGIEDDPHPLDRLITQYGPLYAAG